MASARRPLRCPAATAERTRWDCSSSWLRRGVTPAGTILLNHPGAGLNVALAASVAGSVEARATTLRQAASRLGVTKTDLRPPTSPIYGDMFLPRHSTGKHTAVLMIGGSSGGLADIGTASLLAARGYPTLALAYFKEPGLPATLANIPLEYFQKALTVLGSEPGVDAAHLIVSGVFRWGPGGQSGGPRRWPPESVDFPGQRVRRVN